MNKAVPNEERHIQGGWAASTVDWCQRSAKVIRRNRVILFVTMAMCMLAGALLILFSSPDYRATASVEVQDMPAGAAGAVTAPRSSLSGDSETMMQTQVEVARSRALAEDVARTLALVGSPIFFDGMNEKRPTLGVGTLNQRQVETQRVVQLLRENVTVEWPAKSRVMLISFTSADPVLSARIANGFADSLIRADLKRSFESGVQARRYLLGELNQARIDLERSERDLASYVAQLGGIQADGDVDAKVIPVETSSTLATRLDQLNGFRAQAISERISAQKKWEGARAGKADNLPEVLNNGAMQQLLSQRAAVKASIAEEREFRKDAHPEMREARARLSALDSQIDDLKQNILNSLKEQFDIAERGEKQIQQEIAELNKMAGAERGRNLQRGMLERSVETYRTLHDSLLQRYRDMASQAGFEAGRIQPLDRAAVPTNPSSPNIGFTMILASFGGLLLGLLFVAGRHLFDDAVTSAETLAERTDLPLLGSVPTVGSGAISKTEMDMIASSLLLASVAGLPRSILVTSAQPREGKSATLHALAQSLARMGKSILVIDCDMRRPTQHMRFHVQPSKGVSEVITGQATLEEAIVETAVPGVSLLACGAIPPNPAELLSTPMLDAMLAELQPKYDSILLDGPPILGLSDAPLLAEKVQVAVLAVEWGRNYHGGLRVAVDRVRRTGVTIVGAILTKQQGRSRDYDYHRTD